MPAKTMKRGADCCDPTAIVLPNDAAAETLAGLAWALAHPARVRIVRLLLSRENCVCGEIVDHLPLAQSTVSQHLKILKGGEHRGHPGPENGLVPAGADRT